VRTRLAPLAAACAALLAAPASALADDAQPSSSCLPAKGEISSTGLRGVSVGVQANIRDATGKPLAVSRVSYCVDGGGDFSFALTPDSDVVLVLSTAEGDSIGPINPTSPAESARAEWPKMKKILRTGRSTVYRIDGRRQLILGVAAGRVAYIAAADRLLLEYPGKLGYYLKRLGY
jgi:hypothetical protein